MEKSFVRIREIHIENYKSVEEGNLVFPDPKGDYPVSVLGLYGQNGSGKSALIEAIQLLKFALSGDALPPIVADRINVGSDHASFRFLFDIIGENFKCVAEYEFSIKKGISEVRYGGDDSPKMKYLPMTNIYNEKLSYSYRGDDSKSRKSAIIDTETEDVFVPKKKYNELIGKGKDIKVRLLAEKRIAVALSTSFVFSRRFIKILEGQLRANGADETAYRHFGLIETLADYGERELFVLNTAKAGLRDLNFIPMTSQPVSHDHSANDYVTLHLNKPSLLTEKTLEITKKAIGNINTVLSQIIPGLQIRIRELGKELTSDNEPGVRIQLLSHRDGRDIPLANESNGIKKIIGMLQLLIMFYNQPSITVAIDELDASIFEYLLGEITRIISERGMGQLIFTSHNLRPLETIDRRFVAFTTTNPMNRYTRITNVKDENNLRDIYYRNIVLGSQGEDPLYDPTNNAEIAMAFREAGDSFAD